MLFQVELLGQSTRVCAGITPEQGAPPDIPVAVAEKTAAILSLHAVSPLFPDLLLMGFL